MEINVIDMRAYIQIEPENDRSLRVTNAGHCETVLHTKDRAENPISKENLPTVENNKGLAQSTIKCRQLIKN